MKGRDQSELNQALSSAIFNADLKAIKRAVADGADPRFGNDQPLYRSAEDGHLAAVKFLIEECGADPHARGDMVLGRAIQNGNLAVVRYLIEKCHVDPRAELDRHFFWPAWKGFLGVVKYLVEKYQVDFRADNDAAIVAAAAYGQAPVVDYLAGRIFAPELWRGKSRSEIEAEAQKLCDRFAAEGSAEHARQAAAIIARHAQAPI